MSAGGPIDEHELHAYVDGALSAERRAEIEAHLSGNPDAARQVEEYRRQNALLHAAFDPMLEEPVPAHLHTRPARLGLAGWLRYGGLAASLLAAGALGWVLRGETPSPIDFGEALAQRALHAHLVYVPEVLHPVEVSARQEEHLVGWLSKRLGVPVRAPHLGDAGFRLVGGRLLPGENRPAAQFMYEDPQGRRLTLYIATNTVDARETAFRYSEESGVSTFYWLEGEVGYALSGELEREQLLHVAKIVYRALSG